MDFGGLKPVRRKPVEERKTRFALVRQHGTFRLAAVNRTQQYMIQRERAAAFQLFDTISPKQVWFNDAIAKFLRGCQLFCLGLKRVFARGANRATNPLHD